MARAPRPTAGPEPRPGGSARRRGWLAERLRRLLVRLLAEDLAPLQQQLGEAQHQLGDTSRRVEALEGRSGALQQHLEDLEGRLGEVLSGALQGHLETRIDQVVVEVADLRGAYLATRGEFESLRDVSLPEVVARTDRLHSSIVTVQSELAEVRDGRVARTETDLAGLQHAVETMQRALEQLGEVRLARNEADLARLQAAVDGVHAGFENMQGAIESIQATLEELASLRLARHEADLARLQAALAAVQSLGEELRDERLPALSGRTDALLEQLHLEVTAMGGLLERVLAREPIRIATEPAVEAALPAAVAQAASRFVEALRGSREEILVRAAEHVPLLRGCAPVLDLGCGRGELVEVLQRQGIEARGIDGDPAMVEACRRRGLDAVLGALPEALAEVADSSVGAVTAIHLLEHLPTAGWAKLLEEARRVLRPGGVLLVECPNPETLRVGSGGFWADPTHRVPVHPQAVELVARAVGLEIVETRRLRPFPHDQRLAAANQPPELRRVAERLDEWLSGPRDFLLVARKPRQ